MSQRFQITAMRRTRRAWEVSLQPEAGGEGRTLSLHPFVYLSPEHDTVELALDEAGQVAALTKLMRPGPGEPEERALLYPYYSQTERVDLAPGYSMAVTFKEVTTPAEYEELRYLEQFHYLQAKPAWGRQAYLIARPVAREVLGTPLPAALGALVLTSPSLFSGPRNRIFGWNDKETLTRQIDRVVRIARVVVHPEFRGLGIGARLVRYGAEYARKRWNVKGKAAWAVESVAEMSRYHPFFEQGGLTYVGETNRQDVAHFYDNESSNLGIEQGEGNVLASLRRFRQKVHAPKPMLMRAFVPELQERIRAAAARGERAPGVATVSPLTEPIRLRDVALTHESTSLWEQPAALQERWQEAVAGAAADLSRALAHMRAWTGLDGALAARLERTAGEVEGLAGPWLERLAALGESLAGLAPEGRALAARVEALVAQVEAELKHVSAPGVARADLERRRALNEERVRLLELAERVKLGAASAKQAWVREAFGVEPNQVTQIAAGLNLEIMPGQIVLIVGPSGSGKSTLLSLLRGAKAAAAGTVTPADLASQVAFLDLDFDPSVPVIDLVDAEIGEAVRLLNSVGLAEAHLYMKRRDELSHGQRYRAAFARLLSQPRPVWLADEFCAFLDPVTTLTLCKGVRRQVKERGITFIAAAAKGDYLYEALQPDVVVRINAGGQVWPCPQEQHWFSLPDWPALQPALAGAPEALERTLKLWMRRVDLLTQSERPDREDDWSEVALRLRTLAPDAQRRALGRHLWAVDWYCHRMRNWLETYGEAPAEGWEAYLGAPTAQVQMRLPYVELFDT